MSALLSILVPEIILGSLACLLFLLGCSNRAAMRRLAPVLAMAGLVAAFLVEYLKGVPVERDRALLSQLHPDAVSHYLRLLTCAVGLLLVLLAWPTDRQATGNSALRFGGDAGEFFALMLLSLAGLMLTTVANDLIVLFLALELVSIPTYIMVSISRPLPVAQEAGVKYFFLGALSIGLMIFGFSYLYGTTGQINLTGRLDPGTGRYVEGLAPAFQTAIAGGGAGLAPWTKLGILLVLLGFAFKMAAFPLHFYAGDVYEGAATPVTAFLAFVPKTAGFAATLKLLAAVGGESWALPPFLFAALWVIAALTMTVGNVLGLLQTNVKRVLAYSSVAHSGYMLVGVTALPVAKDEALRGVLFYLAAYGAMNAAAFGVLMLLPARPQAGMGDAPVGGGAAETFDDLAGTGRRHVALGLAMAVACFSLIGIPLTVGFVGKLMLIRPALLNADGWLIALAIVLVVNAAISAAYYLKIVGTMFLRPAGGPGATEEAEAAEAAAPAGEAPLFLREWAISAAVLLSVVATVALGSVPSAAQRLADQTLGRSAGTQSLAGAPGEGALSLAPVTPPRQAEAPATTSR